MTRTMIIVYLVFAGALLGLRVHSAYTRGTFYFDEAYYLLEAQGLHHAIRALPQLVTGRQALSQLKSDMRAEGDLFPPSTAKPTFSLLLLLFSFLPFSLSVSGNLLSVVAFALTAGFLYHCLLAWELSPRRAAFVSTLFLASPIYGYYAVSSLGNCVASLFFIAAIYAGTLTHWKTTGLALGLALTSHYGMAPQVGLFLISLLFFYVAKKPSIPFKQSIMPLFLMMCLPILFYEVIYLFALCLFGNYFRDMHFMTYIQQFVHQLQANAGSALQTYSPQKNILLFTSFARTEGKLISSVLALAGLALLIKPRQVPYQARPALLTAMGLILFWLFNPGVLVSRISVFLVPLGYLTLGAALRLLPSINWPKVGVLIPLELTLLLTSSFRAFTIHRDLKSPYPEALHQLEVNEGYKGPIMDLSNTLVWQLYTHKRMVFHQEDVTTPHQWAIQGMALVRQEPTQRIAFFSVNDQVPWRMRSNPQSVQRFAHLFTQPPSASWDILFSSNELFRYEEGLAIPDLTPEHQHLDLRWLSRKDFAEFL